MPLIKVGGIMRVFKKSLLTLTLLFGILSSVPLSSTTTQMISSTANITGYVQNGATPLVYGLRFTTINAIKLVALGHFEGTNLPMLGDRQVGVWTDSGTLLGSTTVLTTDTQIGNFRYHNLSSPIFLAANQTYRIGALEGANQRISQPSLNPLSPAYWANNFQASPDITVNHAVISNPSGFAFPSNSFSTIVYMNTSALIGLPEPTTYLMMGSFLSLSILAYALKRKKERKA